MTKSKTKKTTKCAVKTKTRVAPVNQLTAVEMRNLTSELIKDVSYSDGDLFITMRNGGRYRYPNVDGQTVQEMLAADSFGRFFNENIRHRKYERLDA